MKIKEAIERIGGFKYVIDALDIRSSAGRRILYALPFLKVSEEIESEIEKTELLIEGMLEETFSRKVAIIQMKMGELRDIASTISRLRYNTTLDDIELFEVKHLAILADSIGKMVLELKLKFVAIPDLTTVIEILDPQGKKIPQFYIYDEYSPTLASIRAELNKINLSEARDEEIIALRLKEKDEEDVIRAALTEKLQPSTEDLKNALKEIATLDLLIAKAHLTKEMQLTKPTFTWGTTFISGLFNPEIESSLQKQGKTFQPVYISIPKMPTLITGANMTGKTVLLKSIALIQTLAQFGFHVPVASAKIVPVDRIVLCTTDEQNELSGLSSFAAEMIRLNKIVKQIKKGESLLVLIDELARTTNPTEGKAIVGGVLNFLSEHKVNSLITTHYTIDTLCRKLRVKGFRLKDENVKIDIHNINNYIDYTLEESNEKEVPHEAIYIAEILGISDDLLDRIKSNLND